MTVQNDIGNRNVELITDWKLYQIVLFNFIQNAVKYNLNNGEIMINYSLQERARMSSNSINAAPTIELVTKITDTGKGIE